MDNSANKNNDEISSLFRGLKFKFNLESIEIDNEYSFLHYIKKIDDFAINFEKKYINKYSNNVNIDAKNEKKFIPLFSRKDKFNESINLNIKNTFSHNSQKNNYNNVFMLNNTLEEDLEFSFEIKLGHGFWDNINYTKSNNNNLIIGLLQLNKDNIKEISDYITINNNKKLEINKSSNVEKVNLFSEVNNIGLQKNYEEYKKYIYNSVDMNEFKVPISKNLKDNNERLIQNNDIIGIVFSNKASKDFIEMRIYINGKLISDKIINKQKDFESNEIEYDDDFDFENKKKNIKENQVLIPFIEVGDNKTIFIKDKSTQNKKLREKIQFMEKIEYIDVYESFPLNHLSDEIFDLMTITEAYFDILDKVGFKIFKYRNKDANTYFKQLIHFFKNYSFINRIVAENCLLKFLSNGIDISKGNIVHFKENLETLLNIINEIESFDESRRIKLLEKLILFLIEIIMENNINLLNIYKLNDQKSEYDIYRKNKFILCFLLFDNFFANDNKNGMMYNFLSKVSLFKNEKYSYNFYYSIFNSNFYFDPAYTREFIGQFYSNNKFDDKKFLNANLLLALKDNFYNKILEDNQYIMNIIIKDINIDEKESTKYLFNFLTEFCSSNDNISITNFIILQLIKYYFNNSVNIDKSKVDKIIFYDYISMNKFQIIRKEENTFYGKIDKEHKHPILNNPNDQDKKESMIFELIIRCSSNFYKSFSLKEKNANKILGMLSEKNYNDLEIYKINHMVDFYRTIFLGNFHIYFGYFTNYLLKFLLICIKEKYLDAVPYDCYLKNILLILDLLKIRCSFIDDNNVTDENEKLIIFSNMDKILKYVTSFLGEIVPKLRNNNFTSKENFEEIISLNIKILVKALNFNKYLIKDTLPSIQKNLVLSFKNLVELYDKEKYKTLCADINELIEFLYGSDSKKIEQISISSRNMIFKMIMSKEIEEYKKKVNEANFDKSNYLENTMYYNIFILIHKRIKIIRESLNKIFENNFLFNNYKLYQEAYFIKFTKILKTFYNFLTDNAPSIIHDIGSSLFLKINSFICKTFKLLSKDNIFKKIQNIHDENPKIFNEFYTTFFFLVSHLLFKKDQASYDYYYQIAQNRKGFYFETFKLNFEKYFGYPEYKTMIDFLDILLKQFKQLCDDKDVLSLEDVNDNSIELEKRDSCPICLEYTDEEKDVHINPCNHLIHKKCLEALISKSSKNQCPLCKRNILGIKEDPSFIVRSNSSYRSIFNEREEVEPFRNLFLFGNNNNNNNSRRNNENNMPHEIGLFENNPFRLFQNNNNINNLGGGLFGNNNNNNRSLFGSNPFNDY